jgi:hypothetical protein
VKKAAGAVEKLVTSGTLIGYSWRQRGTDPHEVDVSGSLCLAAAAKPEELHNKPMLHL